MSFEEIFYEHEGKHREQNNKIFTQFIKEFEAKTGYDIGYLIFKEDVSFSDSEKLFWALHSDVFNNYPELIGIFYDLLKSYKFRMKADLISFIHLASMYTDGKLEDNVNDFLLKMPLIRQVRCNSGRLTICVESMQEISFLPIRTYFKDNYFAKSFLNRATSISECHNLSWQLINFMNNAKLATYLLPMYFSGTYYHTVIKDRDGLIVDPANSSVFDSESFDRLMEGKIVCETPQAAMLRELNAAYESGEEVKYANPLAIAFNKQKKYK